MQNSLHFESSLADMITVESIYESASEIGEHFKKLIQLFGPETFEALIPIVVRVLEQLEDVTVQRNDCLCMVEKLHKQIEELQNEHCKRIEEQRKYQSEIEDIDELWRKENRKLEQYVNYLKIENNRLNALNANEKLSHSLVDLKRDEKAKHDLEKSKDLSNTQLDKLKTKLRILNNEIELKNEEINNLKKEKENLSEENKNLRKIVSLSLNSILDSEDSISDSLEKEAEFKDRIKMLEEMLCSYKSKLENLEQELSGDGAVEAIVHDVIENENPYVKMEDLPVQGPIPKEPEEKLFGYKKNRIWSFFPKLTKAIIR